jgi:hypothetical protein
MQINILGWNIRGVGILSPNIDHGHHRADLGTFLAGITYSDRGVVISLR